MLQLREIECLIALSEHLHFGRAAQVMQISQSRMSQTIQEVEQRVGCRLFERNSRQVEPTIEGRMLIERIRPAYTALRSSYREAVNEVRRSKRTIRIGFTAATFCYASDLVRWMRANAPEYGVTLREMAGEDSFGELRRAEVDALLATDVGSRPGLTSRPLGTETVVLAVPEDHRLAHHASVSKRDFTMEPMLGIAGPSGTPPGGEDAATEWTRKPYGADTVKTWHELLALVAAGQGVALLAGSIAQNQDWWPVRFVPVTDLPSVSVSLICRQDDQGTALRGLLERSASSAALAAQRSNRIVRKPEP